MRVDCGAVATVVRRKLGHGGGAELKRGSTLVAIDREGLGTPSVEPGCHVLALGPLTLRR